LIKQKAILIVEDESDDLELITRALGKDNPGLSWASARNGLEALEYLEKTTTVDGDRLSALPSLILLDLSMPKMGGIKLLHEIRIRKQTRSIPVVVFTSSKNVQDVDDSYEAGANSYISKPTDFTTFRAALRQLSEYWLSLNITRH